MGSELAYPCLEHICPCHQPEPQAPQERKVKELVADIIMYHDKLKSTQEDLADYKRRNQILNDKLAEARQQIEGLQARLESIVDNAGFADV